MNTFSEKARSTLNIGGLGSLALSYLYPRSLAEYRGHAFLLKNGYLLHKVLANDNQISIWRKSNENQEAVEQAVKLAIDKNVRVFGKLPPDLEIVMAQTTEDFNLYKRTRYPLAKRKVKNDSQKGTSLGESRLLVLDYNSLENESDYEPSYPINDYYPQLLAHELAHGELRHILKAKGIHSLPRWIDEGIAHLTANQRGGYDSAALKDMREILKSIPHIPPTNEDLNKIYKGYGPHRYQAIFIKWFFEKYTTVNMPFSANEKPEKGRYDIARIQLLIDVVRRMDPKVSFDEAFKNAFGLTYSDAHKDFMVYLDTIV
jgi:hypothetical protein